MKLKFKQPMPGVSMADLNTPQLMAAARHELEDDDDDDDRELPDDDDDNIEREKKPVKKSSKALAAFAASETKNLAMRLAGHRPDASRVLAEMRESADRFETVQRAIDDDERPAVGATVNVGGVLMMRLG